MERRYKDKGKGPKPVKVNVNQPALMENKKVKGSNRPSIQVTNVSKAHTLAHEVHILGPCVVVQSPDGHTVNIEVSPEVELEIVIRDTGKKSVPQE